jgi:hypothetical protein
MNPAGRVRCKHAAEIKSLCQLLQLKLDRRRCSIGHHASAAAALSRPRPRESRGGSGRVQLVRGTKSPD